jgi:hypothetical protein
LLSICCRICDSPGKICFNLLHSLHLAYTLHSSMYSVFIQWIHSIAVIVLPSNIEKKMLARIRFYYLCPVTLHIVVCLIWMYYYQILNLHFALIFDSVTHFKLNMTTVCTPWRWLHILAETCWSNIYVVQTLQLFGINLICTLLIAQKVYNVKWDSPCPKRYSINWSVL